VRDGVLNRILLIYDEHLPAPRRQTGVRPVHSCRRRGNHPAFGGGCHENLEEDFLFPRFRKAHQLVDLVDILLEQHWAGRRVTAQIERRANAGALKEEGSAARLPGGRKRGFPNR